MKFSEINLVGFAHFVLKMRDLFDKNKNYSIVYNCIGGANEISIQMVNPNEPGKSLPASKQIGIEITFNNPTGGEKDYESAEEAIVTYGNSIKTSFYQELLPSISINIPLKYFDEIDFIESLKEIIDFRPLVPYDEEDFEVLAQYALKSFKDFISNSKIIKFIPLKDFESQLEKK